MTLRFTDEQLAAYNLRRKGIGNCEPVISYSKFSNVATNGYASKREAKRGAELKLMQAAGRIAYLREQVEYELIPKQEGERACAYRADFVYVDMATSETIVEDAKGVRTPDYIIKRKLMLHVHGIRIREI